MSCIKAGKKRRGDESKKAVEEEESAEIKTQTWEVRRSCGGCVQNIKRAIQTLPTTEVIATDLSTKTVHLRYDIEQVTMDTIKTTLSTAKYPVASDQLIEHAGEEASTAR